MKKVAPFLVLCFLISSQSIRAASALRSDTIDIRKTIIDFTISDFITHVISAKTILDIRSKMNNVNELVFDLEGLTVDSVRMNGSSIAFNYSSPVLQIPLPLSMNINDTALVDVYYHGIPIADATWGGFSFVGNYGFQMGVGFNAQPHSFGRTWHPCFDNFVERSAYEFYITTETGKAAICNGLLLDSSTNSVAGTTLWHWKLDEAIPSYLACVAVCNYVFMHKNLVGNAGNIDALITCEAADSNAVNGSFAHLQQSFSMLENHFGTYSWPRVGYSLVPFNAGAMEHATNISVGRPFVDGSLTYETLFAHELSHHWFGDLVTCSTAGDMWLNEGFASYCEALHTEYVYGSGNYLNVIKANHYDVLNKAHITDQGYRGVANMDSLFTYGATVYDKGKDVIHTLRAYMGDSLFFNTLKSFINSHKFQSINSLQLRDYLSAQSGINLTNYFNDWIFSPGFTHFSIDSTQVIANGSLFDVQVFLRQRKHHSPDYYHHVPLELGFYDTLMNLFVYKLDFDGRCMQFNVSLPFNPAMMVLDPRNQLGDAITDEQKTITSTGNTVFTQAKCKLIIKSMINSSDSSLLHFEHHWVAPDRFKNANSFPGYVLCDSRYWSLSAVNLQNLQGLMMFSYDAGSNNSYLDSSWIKNTEDSIRMFYRKDARDEWQFANDSLRAGSLVDKSGQVYIRELKEGEYTFGIKRSGYVDPISNDAPAGGCGLATNLHETSNFKNAWCMLYPNPMNDYVMITCVDDTERKLQIEIEDMNGQMLYKKTTRLSSNNYRMPTQFLQSGLYFIKVCDLNHGDCIITKMLKL